MITKQDIKDKYDILSDYVRKEIKIPNFTDKEGLILIVGSSGSGKTTILKQSGLITDIPVNNNVSIIDNFSNPENAEKLLIAMGFRSIPAWFRKINEVSNGEKHRATCAIALDKGIYCIDEFTSVVDRNTAKSLSVSFNKWYQENGKTIVIATCHRDVERWLCPDHVYDADFQGFLARRYLQRPKIQLCIRASNVEDWVYFKKHHYLSSTMSKSVHCYTAYINNMRVGFLAVIHGCGRDIRSYWRESRIVVLPEFQGLGIGKSLSNTIAEEYTNRGLRYFAKTAHPALGLSRDKDIKWRATSTNHKKRGSYLKKDGTARLSKGYGKTEKEIYRDAMRICYSHEFIGA